MRPLRLAVDEASALLVAVYPLVGPQVPNDMLIIPAPFFTAWLTVWPSAFHVPFDTAPFLM